MSQSSFTIIFKQAYKYAEELSTMEYSDVYLEKYQTYSSFISQLIQILNNMPYKSDEVKSQIKNLLAEHKKVENRLEHEKTEIGKKISDKICKEHIRQKYNSKSIKSALLNKEI